MISDFTGMSVMISNCAVVERLAVTQRRARHPVVAVAHPLAVMLAVAHLDARQPFLERRAGIARRDQPQRAAMQRRQGLAVDREATSVSGASALSIGSPREIAGPEPSR